MKHSLCETDVHLPRPPSTFSGQAPQVQAQASQQVMLSSRILMQMRLLRSLSDQCRSHTSLQ